MLYHIFLTQRCNLNCKYCGGTMPATTTPLEISYDFSQLVKFLQTDDTEPIISFYGGEPLLRIQKMEQLLDAITAKFVIQTNGTLLPKIKPRYLKKIDAILLSIDGRKNITNHYRGLDVYQKIEASLNYLKQQNYAGELIARMTVSEKTDIFKEVTFLLKQFNAVHWQLNMFWDPKDSWKDKTSWINESYNPGITRLIDFWIQTMKKKGIVLRIVPFTAIMYDLLRGNKTQLRCGSGRDAFAIATSGDILACPISPEYDFMHVGNIGSDTVDNIKDSLLIDGRCLSCEVYHICGGRCLFVNKTKEWNLDEFERICSTVKHLIKELRNRVSDVQMLIKHKQVVLNDFKYPTYNNGCEIIP